MRLLQSRRQLSAGCSNLPIDGRITTAWEFQRGVALAAEHGLQYSKASPKRSEWSWVQPSISLSKARRVSGAR